MHRLLGSCLFAVALAYPAHFVIVSSPAQAESSLTGVTDFSAQRAQRGAAQRGARRPQGAQRPSRRPSGAHRPRPPQGAHRHPGMHRPPSAGHRHWNRPRRYSWRPGGAIAAGAALGFVAAASAAAWAGPPPSPGLCWYYTDWTRTQGFWDFCP